MKKLILLVIAAMLLASCAQSGDDNLGNDTTSQSDRTLNLYTIKRNDEIDNNTAKAINDADMQLVKSIADNDIALFNMVCSDELSDIIGDDGVGTFINEFYGSIKSSDYTQLDMYHTNFQRTGEEYINVLHRDEDAFDLFINSISNDVYISLLLFEGDYGDIILANYYIEQEDEVKLYAINYSWYSLYGMNAIDYYMESMQLYENGYIVPAYLNMIMSYDVSRLPAYIRYKNLNDISDYYQNIHSEYNEFLSNSELFTAESDNPIFSIGVLYSKQEYVIEIKYLTDIVLSEGDTESIEAEAAKVHEYVCEAVPGFDESFSHFAYTAFNALPTDANKQYESYTSVFDDE